MSVAVVPELGDAIDHVNRYGTGHTEAIVTRDLAAAQRFTSEVDAAAVIVNASTRFTDGEEFGFGAEIGISTQKLHAAVRWVCASSPRTSTSSGATARFAADPTHTGALLPLMAERFASVDDVMDRLRGVEYLSDSGIAGVVFLADRLEKPVLVEGPAGVGKTELAKAVAATTGAG